MLVTTLSNIQEVKKTRFDKILLIKPSSLGDILQSFPAFSLLRKSLPGAEIDWIVNDNCIDVINYVRKDLNNVIVFRRGRFKRRAFHFGEFLNLINSIRADRYDLTIDMQGLMRSAFMAGISKARVKAGFCEVKEGLSRFFYNRRIAVPQGVIHAIEKNVSLVSGILGIDPVVPDFRLPESETDIGKKLGDVGISGRKYMAIAPGARWKTKTWPESFFAEVSDIVSDAVPDVSILLLGSKSEIDVAQKVIGMCRKSRPVSLAGYTDLPELVELIRRAELLLTHDSGPMHIAAAMRVPVFALFGPTLPERTGPYWQYNKVYQAESGCVKCLDRNCSKGTLECQTAIRPEAVAGDLIDKLKGVR